MMRWMQLALNLVLVIVILVMAHAQGFFSEYRATMFGNEPPSEVVDDDRALSG